MAFDLVGNDLDHYTLVEPLGAGSMSEVYRARDNRLDKEVAVKVIREHALIDPARVRRFEREARAAARLQHPNVATVYFYGTHGERPFFAMEWIRGRTLAAIIEGRVAFRWSQYLALFAQAAAGLQAAADQGVLHRDVKPANLLVDDGGRLKVVDFGLAKLGDDRPLSRSQVLAGTPYYVPPEVVARTARDSRGDVYSLGASFFHLAAGRRPFDADTPYDVMMKHLGEPAPFLADLGQHFPRGLASLLAQMMAKRPDDRPPSFGEVLLRLERLRGEFREWNDTLSWCAKEELNTPSDDELCRSCGAARDQWERPEWFDVDVVAWSRNDGETNVAAYLARALGQEEDLVREVLRPLPFRAAFQQPRDRARTLQKRLYDLGADVSLVAAEAQPEPPPEDARILCFDPPWPAAPLPGATPPAAPDEESVAPPNPGTTWERLALFLALLSVLGLVLERSSLEREIIRLQHLIMRIQPATMGSPFELGPMGRPLLGDSATPLEQGPKNPAQFGNSGDPIADALANSDVPGVAENDEGAGATGEVNVDDPAEGDDPAASSQGKPSDASEGNLPPAPRFSLSLAGDLSPAQRRAGIEALNRAGDQVAEAIGWPRGSKIAAALVTKSPGGGAGAWEGGRAWRSLPIHPRLELVLGPSPGPSAMELDAMAVHQLCRGVLRQRLAGNVPSWLELGLAVQLERGKNDREALASAVAAGPLPTEVAVKEGANEGATEEVTSSFVAFLVRQRGWKGLRGFLGALGRGTPPEAAATDAWGQPLSALEAEWVANLGGGL